MKASVDQATLDTALKNFDRIAKKAESFSMGIKFSFVDSGLWLFTTDLEIGLKSRIDCETMEPGEVCFDRKVYDLINKFPKGEILFVQEKKRITISAGSVKYNLFPNTTDLPDIDFLEEEKDKFISISQPQMEEVLSSTLFATGQDEGIFFLQSDEKPLTVISTDGRQLAFLETASKGFKETICVSRRGLLELARLYSGAEIIYFTLTRSHFIFRFNNTFLSLRLLDVEMPNYNKVLNCNIVSRVILDRSSLMSILKRVIIASGTADLSARFEFTGGFLKIMSEGPLTNFSETLEVDTADQLQTFSLNSQCLLNALRSMHSEKVMLQQSDLSGPILFTEPGRENFSYFLARLIKNESIEESISNGKSEG